MIQPSKNKNIFARLLLFIIIGAAVNFSAFCQKDKAPAAEEKKLLSNQVLPAAQDTEKKDEDFLKYEEPVPLKAPETLPLILRTVFSLLIIVGLIYAVVYIFKKVTDRRTQAAQSGRMIKIIDVLYLSPQRAVYLLGLPDKILVIGATNENLNLLSEINNADLVESLKDKEGLKKPLGFKEQLQKFSGNFPIK